MKFLIESIFYSYSQIYFNNRLWFGIILFLTSFLNPEIGLAAFLGVLISNFTAYILNFDKEKIRTGFYGFNGILFGAASLFYFENHISFLYLLPIFILITFFISAALEHYLATHFNLPGLSLPFVLSIYIYMIFLSNFNFITPRNFQIVIPEIIQFFPQIILYYFKSLSLILLNSNVLAGFIIAISILIFSRVQFVLSVISYSITYFILITVLDNPSEKILIISGFNSILTGIALGGSLIIPSRKSLLIVFFSSILVIIFTFFFERLLSYYLLPVLVLPFNSLVFATLYSLKFRTEQSDIVLLYFTPGSPEENYYYHHNRKQRFDRLTYFLPELPFLGEWYVNQGMNGEFTHKGYWKDAWDFVIKDLDNKEYANDGYELTDYYCYRIPVTAPLEGRIVKIQDGISNNEIGKYDVKNNWGNTIVIDHGKGLYSALSHLEPNSIRVKVGDNVKKGTILALCGNSGRSPYPHLHFQFQKSDKIGEHTIPYPFAYYIESKGDKFELRMFDYPVQNTSVQNLELHKSIQKAFNFTIGDKITLECVLDGHEFTENWEIKIDIFNNLYIESDNKSILYFYLTEKIYYAISFLGNKESALYYFYLSSTTVPFCFKPNLIWREAIPLSKIQTSFLVFLSEFLLLFKEFIKARNEFKFSIEPETNNYLIKSNLEVIGENIFSYMRLNYQGEISIDPDGNIKEIKYSTEKNTFYAKQKKEMEDRK